MKYRSFAIFTILMRAAVPASSQSSSPVTNLHYAPNGNFDSNGNYLPAADGFNLADVSSVGALNSLPAGVMGLVFLGLCDGADAAFIQTVQPYIGNPKLYAFYLIDEPDPTGKYKTLCTAANLKAESDWIHGNVPGARTFIVLMNLGSTTSPIYANTYNPANTDIDLFGMDPAPVRPQFTGGADYGIINADVSAAEAAGVPAGSIVPVYQVFGGGGYTTYTVPTPDQEEQILSTWASLVPTPAFDFAYSWGTQEGDQALSTTPDLQSVFLQHNANNAAFCCAALGNVVSAGLSAPLVQSVSPNAILSIFGQGFATPGTNRSVTPADLVNGSLPTNLNGVCVSIGARRAPMFLVTPGQLNIQAPELPPPPSSTSVQVITNCDLPNQSISNPMEVSVQASSPEFFYSAHDPDGGGPVAAIDGVTGGQIGDPARLGEEFSLAYPGETVVIYATGFGLTTPPVMPGLLAPTEAQVTGMAVSIDGTLLDESAIQYAGAAPGSAGLNQLNILLPASLTPGDHTVVMTINGSSSPPSAYISVGPAVR